MSTSHSSARKASPRLDLFSAFVELHVLYHASTEPVYGLWLIEELREHGYRIGPGTLYPLLHSLEGAAMLRSSSTVAGGKVRRYYRITAKGRRYLDRARIQLMELVAEILPTGETQRFIRLIEKRSIPNSVSH